MQVNYDSNIMIRITPDIKSQAKAKAIKKGIKLSEYIRMLIISDLKEK